MSESDKLSVVKVQVVAPWRLVAVGTLFAIIGMVLIWRFVTLQVLPGETLGQNVLQDRAARQMIRNVKLPAYRGVITDRNGEPLAVSTPVISLFGDPRELILERDSWGKLASALKLDPKYLADRLQRRAHKKFIYLKRRMAPGAAQQVLALKINGVYGQKEYQRFYPAGEVAAHLVGFTNIDDQGQEGLELAYNGWLEGVPGKKQVVKDLRGNIIRDVKQISDASPGKPMQLSIDLRLQYSVYRELKAAVKRVGAHSGSVVLLDAATGEVLAMANQPSYNPNDRTQLKPYQLRNRATIDLYEPGSTMKPFTMIAALESGQYTPNTIVNTSPGRVRIGRKTLLDPVNYGAINMTKIITKSSQVGISKVALSLEPEAIRDVFYRVGLGQSTGSGFPGEGVGVLPNKTKWQPIERAAFAFGHGLSVTSLQLAQAYAVLGSGGVKRPISLLKVEQPELPERVIDKDIALQVVSMLQTVTEKGGTATRARVEGYNVAGKTGTIHKVGRSGYEGSKYIAVFAGMAPAKNPKVIAVVMIDDPKGDEYYGGEVAAPIFSSIIGEAMRLLGVPANNYVDHYKSDGNKQHHSSAKHREGIVKTNQSEHGLVSFSQ